MAANEQTLTDEQFATISANVLHQTLIEVSRTVGKRIFRELEAGKRVALTQLRMEDEGQVRLDLTLDHTEFRGGAQFFAIQRFNFGIAVSAERYIARRRYAASRTENDGRERPGYVGTKAVRRTRCHCRRRRAQYADDGCDAFNHRAGGAD